MQDLQVLVAAQQWLDAGHRVLLATVVKTWGSSPRPEGSILIVRDDGLPMGSVSGGCIEDDLIAQVRRDGIDPGASPWVTEYGVAADDAHRFGLPCGGTIRLVMEPLGARSGLAELIGTVRNGQLAVRALDLASGITSIRAGDSGDMMAFDGNTLITVHGPRYRMLLIGAGELSKYVAVTAVGLGYDVTVCDPRDEYHDDWNMQGVRLVTTMPDDTVLDMRLDARSAVVALTHDPKLDDLALMEALRTDSFYVGAIGSRRNNITRRDRLRLFDLDDAALARLRGPIGLYIGSRTPAEIALSVLAEITACKNQVPVVRAFDVTAGKLAQFDAKGQVRDALPHVVR
ncbi:xanthine dehydrogenase accessory factor [Paraburkholderia silvatlantica]|uniref:Xanthine dehydrogenase accessory factor n=1 Tax=Paraburkholderia silvatlantica TaxID=321895 RepID=A0A2V4UXV8_9BURK|nr:XdhC family protein [Paraburkholderia silvatlantica]PYE25446.1 xanthine dehydrogenase accessory factor [Paraburkholderia silvatlantica]